MSAQEHLTFVTATPALSRPAGIRSSSAEARWTDAVERHGAGAGRRARSATTMARRATAEDRWAYVSMVECICYETFVKCLWVYVCA